MTQQQVDPKIALCLAANAKIHSLPIVPEPLQKIAFPACVALLHGAETIGVVPSKPKKHDSHRPTGHR